MRDRGCGGTSKSAILLNFLFSVNYSSRTPVRGFEWDYKLITENRQKL